MLSVMKPLIGQALTVRGPVAPSALGRVTMHEHLQSDIYDWKTDRFIVEEKPATAERRQYLLENAVPLLRQCHDYGMHAYCDTTMMPWRAWPDIYPEISEQSGTHIILATGFYREMEVGTYWVKTENEAIWPVVRHSSVEELAELCAREIAEGIHGTGVHAGCIKLGTSQAPMTPLEIKTFRAGARAQAQTGVHITTHCTQLGAETSQLTILEEEGVDLRRVVIGHTAGHIMDKGHRHAVLEWMKRGANFLPTNLGVADIDHAENWRPLVEGIHEIFDAGHGSQLCLGLDSGYCSESGDFGPMTFLPPHPWTHMFTNTLPAFRKLGLTEEEERTMLEVNPQRILPVQ